MAIIPATLDYTDKDFDSIRLRLQATIRSVFPDWTDFNVANFGEVLLESFAFVGGALTFYQDNQARESRLITATQRKNVINLAKMLGYAATGATAARATEVITLKSIPVGSVTIPAGSKILTADITAPIAFQLLTDAVIAAGANPPTISVTVENSETESDGFSSTGLPDQAFQLSRKPYIDGATTITAPDGSYVQVDNFLDSTGTSKHFIVSVDQSDVATIKFGDGVNGAIPSIGSIAVTYKTGGGSGGNVDPGTINRLQGTFADNLGNPTTVSVTNPQKADGGLDRQTVNQIKALAPASLRAETRCVAREDFEINALKVAGVARALMTTSNEDPGVEENSGILYVVPVGGGVASSLLLSNVLAQCTTTAPHTVTFRLATQVASYFAINVFVRVFKVKGFTAAQVAANIRQTLKGDATHAGYFSISLLDGTPNPNIDFGANFVDANGNPDPTLPLGPIFDKVEETLGVRKIGGTANDFLLNGQHQDVTLQPRQFPVLGTITIIDGDTGAQI